MTTLIDADIKGFFDSVNHAKLMICLQQRVADKKFLQLVERFLKAGVMEEGEYHETDQGTPQGGILSPILSNIFLHYVLDRWFVHQVLPRLGGDASLFRYADDFVICLQDPDEAEWLLQAIRERFIAVDSRCPKKRLACWRLVVKHGANGEPGDRNPKRLTFWGSPTISAPRGRGNFKVGRATSRKKSAEPAGAERLVEGDAALPLRGGRYWSPNCVGIDNTTG